MRLPRVRHSRPDDNTPTLTEQLDVLAWLGHRIACQRCRRALDTANKAVGEMARSGQPMNPPPELAHKFWAAYLTVFACIAADHAGAPQYPLPTEVDGPPPDHGRLHP